MQALASPVTGGGLPVDRIEQLFLLAHQQKADDAPAFVWRILDSIGQRLVQDGKAIETPEGNLKELADRHASFLERRLPVFQQLGIA